MLTLLLFFFPQMDQPTVSVPSGRLEFTVADTRLKYTVRDGRLKYTVTQ
jgi:hypothetical protein